MPADLPALRQLTRDVNAAMRDAEKNRGAFRGRRIQHPWILALVLLVFSVPSALAVNAVVDGSHESLPATMQRGSGPRAIRATRPAAPVAQGQIDGDHYTLLAQRCEYDGVVKIAQGFLLGNTGAAGTNSCFRSRRPQALIDAFTLSGGGGSWIYGITRDRVAAINIFLVHHDYRPGQAPRDTPAGRVRVRTQPFNARAARTADLPPGYRLFVAHVSREVDYSRLIARDATGRVLFDCRRRACDTHARHGD